MRIRLGPPQRNFETTARRVLAELPMGLREATVEDVRTALENITHALGKATRQQYILRTKSLLGYAHKVGYSANDPVFVSRKGRRLSERTVNDMVTRTAKAAGINEAVSPHWLRHAHGSHAIERGASLPELQATLGHGNISTTLGYLHARPDSSSRLRLDRGVFLR
jgi:site-specific recombinase XerC